LISHRHAVAHKLERKRLLLGVRPLQFGKAVHAKRLPVDLSNGGSAVSLTALFRFHRGDSRIRNGDIGFENARRNRVPQASRRSF
jgi:hypothetical protein